MRAFESSEDAAAVEELREHVVAMMASASRHLSPMDTCAMLRGLSDTLEQSARRRGVWDELLYAVTRAAAVVSTANAMDEGGEA